MKGQEKHCNTCASSYYQEEKNVNLFAPHNKVFISGIIEKDFEFCHEFLFELFYKTRIRTIRLSDTEDYVPIVVSELLINNESIVLNYVKPIQKTFKRILIKLASKF